MVSSAYYKEHVEPYPNTCTYVAIIGVQWEMAVHTVSPDFIVKSSNPCSIVSLSYVTRGSGSILHIR